MSSLTLKQQMLRTASIFQALAAICTGLVQGGWLIDLFERQWTSYRLYDALFALLMP